jgi:two-component system chemotaxis response regulator CheY
MPISVLVCDDLASVQSMLRRMLERDGLVVSGTASAADEVLARYAEHRPDVVLLDYRMPGAIGLSLLRDVLAYDPDARVVMCSGTGDPKVRGEAMAAGAMDWVLKPIFPQTFIATLRELIAKSPRTRRDGVGTDGADGSHGEQGGD